LNNFLKSFLLAGWASVLHAAAAETGTGYLSEELGRVGETGAATAATPSLLPTLLNVTFSLAFVVGLVYVAYWLLLRWRDRQGIAADAQKAGLIRLLERQYLDGKHAVAVVEVGDKILTLGLGEQVTLLDQENDPDKVESLRQRAPLPANLMGFKEQLQRVGQRLRKEEWGQAKKAMRSQADEMEAQLKELRGRRGGGR
jgi:flagellar protein FliO/FliZ